MTDQPDDEDEFQELLNLYEKRADQVALHKEAAVNSPQEVTKATKEVSADLAVVRGFMRDLLAGRVKLPEVKLCNRHGKMINLVN